MTHRFAVALVVVAELSVPAFAQGRLEDASLDEGALPDPVGWRVPAAFAHYRVAWTNSGFAEGAGCVELGPGPDSGANPGNLMQDFDAAPYGGTLVRYRAGFRESAGPEVSVHLLAVQEIGTVTVEPTWRCLRSIPVSAWLRS